MGTLRKLMPRTMTQAGDDLIVPSARSAWRRRWLCTGLGCAVLLGGFALVPAQVHRSLQASCPVVNLWTSCGGPVPDNPVPSIQQYQKTYQVCEATNPPLCAGVTLCRLNICVSTIQMQPGVALSGQTGVRTSSRREGHTLAAEHVQNSTLVASPTLGHRQIG